MQRLLDPEETLRRQRLRARILRRNRIQREVAIGRAPRRRRRLDNTNGDKELEQLLQQAASKAYDALDFGDHVVVGARYKTPLAMAGSHMAQAVAIHAQAKEKELIQLPSSPPKAVAVNKTTERTIRLRKRWQQACKQVAIQRHRDILAKDPNRAWRQMRLGVLLMEQHEFEEAAEHFQLAIAMDPSASNWRRLGFCWLSQYEKHGNVNWELLWHAKDAYEQASKLSALEVTCNPTALMEYARVHEALGNFSVAERIYRSIIDTFPRFHRSHITIFRWLLLQRYHLFSSPDPPMEKAWHVEKCIDLANRLLLNPKFTQNEENGGLVMRLLYLHARLHELLHWLDRTNIKAFEQADRTFEVLFQEAIKRQLISKPTTARVWKSQYETYTTLAMYFEDQRETILAADALDRALQLMASDAPSDDVNRIHWALARNYYDCNQMEKAIKALEVCFSINKFQHHVRQHLKEWFPAKWKERLDLEDGSQVAIARVFRGLCGRLEANKRRYVIIKSLESKYKTQPYQARILRDLLRFKSLRHKYSAVFARQEAAAHVIQKRARKYLARARIRWYLQAQNEQYKQALKAKLATKKYKYHKKTRWLIAHSFPDDPERYAERFAREERAAMSLQRVFRGFAIRKCYQLHAKWLQKQAAVVLIQRAWRHHRNRPRPKSRGRPKSGGNDFALAVLMAQEFEVDEEADHEDQLARRVERLYRRWKAKTALAKAKAQERLAQAKAKDRNRHAQAMVIQRAWRRFSTRKHCERTNTPHDQAKSLVAQMKRGHDRLMAQENDAACRIQSVYRGRRVRQSMQLLPKDQARQWAPRQPSAIERLVQTWQVIDQSTAPAIKYLVCRGELDVQSVVHNRRKRRTLSLEGLALDHGDYDPTTLHQVVQLLPQWSKTLRVLAIGPIQWTGKENVQTMLSAMVKCLCTTNFLVEELVVEANRLVALDEQNALATLLSDFFFGRYGKCRRVTLAHVHLLDRHVELIAQNALASTNHVLQQLDLNANVITDDGAIALARALQTNTTLVSLNLADNHIGSVGAKALVGSLWHSNRTLQSLVLSNNHVLQDAIEPLMMMLRVNGVIEDVDLRGNLIVMASLVEVTAMLVARRACSDIGRRMLMAQRAFPVQSAVKSREQMTRLIPSTPPARPLSPSTGQPQPLPSVAKPLQPFMGTPPPVTPTKPASLGPLSPTAFLKAQRQSTEKAKRWKQQSLTPTKSMILSPWSLLHPKTESPGGLSPQKKKKKEKDDEEDDEEHEDDEEEYLRLPRVLKSTNQKIPTPKRTSMVRKRRVALVEIDDD